MSSNKPRSILQWIAGGTIALVGVLSERVDATGGARHGFWSSLHVLFGVMLCVGVLCRFRYGLWTCGAVDKADVTVFARQLTRNVYVLLYSLLAVKVLLPCVGAGNTSPESFQPYVAAGVAAVLLTRGLAAFPTDLAGSPRAVAGPRRELRHSLFQREHAASRH